jgi:N utilization substance protein B
MGKRRRARELVLQYLYAETMVEGSWETLSAQSVGTALNDQELLEFSGLLFRKTIAHKEELDREVAAMLENWDISRVALIDRLILRLALCELLYFEEIPPKVTMNEAIDLAKKFSTGESGRFVNGILDALYKKFNGLNRIQKTGRGLL